VIVPLMGVSGLHLFIRRSRIVGSFLGSTSLPLLVLFNAVCLYSRLIKLKSGNPAIHNGVDGVENVSPARCGSIL
jgi:hypothetical protein